MIELNDITILLSKVFNLEKYKNKHHCIYAKENIEIIYDINKLKFIDGDYVFAILPVSIESGKVKQIIVDKYFIKHTFTINNTIPTYYELNKINCNNYIYMVRQYNNNLRIEYNNNNIEIFVNIYSHDHYRFYIDGILYNISKIDSIEFLKKHLPELNYYLRNEKLKTLLI